MVTMLGQVVEQLLEEQSDYEVKHVILMVPIKGSMQKLNKSNSKVQDDSLDDEQ